jgi:hypothetical protein
MIYKCLTLSGYEIIKNDVIPKKKGLRFLQFEGNYGSAIFSILFHLSSE